jgi:hypothetical protein
VKDEVKTIYIDGVDWQNEIGEIDVTVWPSKESILERTPCAMSCGVMQCEIRAVEWVYPQSLCEVEGEAKDMIKLWEGHIERYKQRIESIEGAIRRAKSERTEKVGEFTVVSHCERVMVSKEHQGRACLNKRKDGTAAFFYKDEEDNEKIEGMTLDAFKQECKQRWGIEFEARGWEY